MALPPGPREPAAFQLLWWIRDPFGLLETCQKRYGDAFVIRLPALSSPFMVLSDPVAVKEVFAMGADLGHAGKANSVLRPFLGDHSVILLDGAEHMRQRKMMMPAFHGERMQAYGQAMLDLAHQAVDTWPLGRPFPVHKSMQWVTLQVILRTVFGMEEGPRHTRLADALTRGLDEAGRPFLMLPWMQRDLGRFSPWGRYKRKAAEASEILREEIRRGRSEGTAGRTDVLAALLEARDDRGEPLSEDEVHDELVTLLVAGHETTATALAWSLRWILPDAPLVARLRDELASAEGDPARIAKLELLDATVKETLRLQPVIALVGRVLQANARVGGFDVPAGTAVAPCVYLVHRRPSLYPEPDRFWPERFFSFKPSPWEWIPFGGGLRRCLGAAFATYEMKMVLASMLPRVDARLATNRVRAARRSVTMTPSGGLPIVVTARRPRAAPRRAA
jgi:cytochrome P450